MSRAKKYIVIALKIFRICLFVFSFLVMVFTLISVNNFDKDRGNGLAGNKFFIVVSDSMRPEFKSGDLIVTKAAKNLEVNPGDIITYYSIDPSSYGEIMTHKVISATEYSQKPAFITQGINVDKPDLYPAVKDRIIGKYRFSVPGVGYIFNFFRTPLGYFLIIFIPFIVLIAVEGVNFFRLVIRYKKEQDDYLSRQRAEIEQEKARAQQLFEELSMLRLLLEQGEAADTMTALTDGIEE